jgi:hypothetical protein
MGFAGSITGTASAAGGTGALTGMRSLAGAGAAAELMVAGSDVADGFSVAITEESRG